MNWVVAEAMIFVESSCNAKTGTETYRIWDENQAIPHPTGVRRVSAQILLQGEWEDMFFNQEWGQRYNPLREGTWLKQKTSKHFRTANGRWSFKVRHSTT